MIEKQKVCVDCGNEFTQKTKYSSGSYYDAKYCESCLSVQRSKAAQKSAAKRTSELLKSSDRDSYIRCKVDEFNTLFSRPPTYSEFAKYINCSSKTLVKVLKDLNKTFSEYLSELGCIKTKSKFQDSVLVCVHKILPNIEIVSEKTFEDLRNPITNRNLWLDIYIPSMRIAIEADGTQHTEIHSNFFITQDGHISVKESDRIKEKYCKDNDIKLVRIPYNKEITNEYISKFLEAQ